MSYDGLDEDDEVNTVLTNNQNDSYYCNVYSNFKSNEEAEENLFEKVDDEIKVTPKTTFNSKAVHVKKNLQALYNKDANKIIEQPVNEKENLIF